jgi:hypothetical protein
MMSKESIVCVRYDGLVADDKGKDTVNPLKE